MGLPLASIVLLSSPLPTAPEFPVEQPIFYQSDETAADAQGGEEYGTGDPLPGTQAEAPDGAIVVTGDAPPPPGDPLEDINLKSFELTQNVDQALVAPLADAYEEELPKPLRRGLRNFLRNLLEPVNFLNYMLQLKPGKAAETLGRFAINSTIGVAGLIDVAKKEPFNLPYRRNGFANTLGYYGVGPGPFLVLPLVGATTLRDVLGSGIDQAVLPFAVGAPFNTPYYGIPAYTVNSLEFRIEFDEKLQKINDSVDPYSSMRETYLCQREAEIAALKNRPPPRDCSLEALFPDEYGLAPAATATTPFQAGAPVEENAPVVSDGEANPAESAPVQVFEIPPATNVEPAAPAEAPVVETEPASSITLENGCALLEQGDDALHVVSC